MIDFLVENCNWLSTTFIVFWRNYYLVTVQSLSWETWLFWRLVIATLKVGKECLTLLLVWRPLSLRYEWKKNLMSIHLAYADRQVLQVISLLYRNFHVFKKILWIHQRKCPFVWYLKSRQLNFCYSEGRNLKCKWLSIFWSMHKFWRIW